MRHFSTAVKKTAKPAAAIVGAPLGRKVANCKVEVISKAGGLSEKFLEIMASQGEKTDFGVRVTLENEKLESLFKLVGAEKITKSTFPFYYIPPVGELGENFILSRQLMSLLSAGDGYLHVFDKMEELNDDFEMLSSDMKDKDRSFLEKKLPDLEKKNSRKGDTSTTFELRLLERCMKVLEADKWLLDQPWNEAEAQVITENNFMTTKPITHVHLCPKLDPKFQTFYGRVNEAFLTKNALKIKGFAVLALPEADAAAHVQPVVREVRNMMNLADFFTQGETEVRAWPVVAKSKIPKAAGQIHTDFETRFISADVTSFNDFMAAGSEEMAAKTGKTRPQNKEYIVEDSDIVTFRFAPGKKKK